MPIVSRRQTLILAGTVFAVPRHRAAAAPPALRSWLAAGLALGVF